MVDHEKLVRIFGEEELTETMEPPPINYYELLDWWNISKTSVWWLFMALVRDPKLDKIHLILYKMRKWRKEKDDPTTTYWRPRTTFRINNFKNMPTILEGFEELAEKWKTLREVTK